MTVIAGRYEIVAPLGEGGMGQVVRARDTKLDREVALKLLPAKAVGDEKARARLLREARAAAKLSHPGIVHVYDTGETHDGGAFIAMELVQGRTLRDVLAAGGSPPATIVRALVECARALAYAHAKGSVHRDVKPENIMIRDDGRAALLDFGIAKAIVADAPTLTDAGQVLGTPAYLSPEQARDEELDGRADEFALAVTAYEALTGKLPWKSNTLPSMMAEILRDDPPPPSTINAALPPAVDTVLLRALAKRREDRYADLEAFADALEEILAKLGGPLRHTPPSLAQTEPLPSPGAITPPSRRGVGPWPLVSLGTLVLAAAIVLVQRNAGAPATPATGLASSAAQVPAPASAAPTGVRALTDLPVPASSSADALAAYRSGLQAMRDGAEVEPYFAKALALDPSMSAAHVRLAVASLTLVNGPGVTQGRAHFQAATKGRADLSPRDQALLEAMEPMFRTSFQARDAAPRLAAALAPMPDDVELLYLLGVVEFWQGAIDDAVTNLTRATQIDPGFGLAFHRLAMALGAADRNDEALTAARTCVNRLPDASVCWGSLAKMQAVMFDNAGAAESFRRGLAVEPDNGWLYIALAEQLQQLGTTAEAVQAVVDQGVARMPEGERAAVRLEFGARLVDIPRGDFAAAEQKLAALEKTPGAPQDRAEQWGRASTFAQIELEIGRGAEAAKVAERYTRSSEAWAPDPRVTGANDLWFLHLERRQHVISDGALEQARAAYLSRTAAAAAASFGEHRGNDHGRAWIDAWAYGVDTPESAVRALTERPGFGPLPGRIFLDPIELESIGQVYLLAGRPADAVRYLEEATRTHYGLGEAIMGWVRAGLDLGKAKEALGDVIGACDAYATVLARWGEATPKSITADAAHARRNAIGCLHDR
jgi:serine/threonine-protein kinase